MRIMINYSEQVSCMKSGLPDIFLSTKLLFLSIFFSNRGKTTHIHYRNKFNRDTYNFPFSFRLTYLLCMYLKQRTIEKLNLKIHVQNKT